MPTMTATSDVHDAVLAFRKVAIARRDFAATIPTRMRGRNVGATVAAETRHNAAVATALKAVEATCAPDDYKVIAGLLTEEDALATRVRAARAAGHDRPEVKRRLLEVRREIKSALARLAEVPLSFTPAQMSGQYVGTCTGKGCGPDPLYVVLTVLGKEHVEVEWTEQRGQQRATFIRYPGLSLADTIEFCQHAAEDPSVLQGAADWTFIEDPA
jgi:hypothetical protein